MKLKHVSVGNAVNLTASFTVVMENGADAVRPPPTVVAVNVKGYVPRVVGVPLRSRRWRLLEKLASIPSGRNPSVSAILAMETSVPKYDLAEYDQLDVRIPTNGSEMLASNRMTCPIVKVSVVGRDGLNEGSGEVRAPTREIV
jgi:hypothetical protein